jgi:hypothetical protein
LAAEVDGRARSQAPSTAARVSEEEVICVMVVSPDDIVASREAGGGTRGNGGAGKGGLGIGGRKPVPSELSLDEAGGGSKRESSRAGGGRAGAGGVKGGVGGGKGGTPTTGGGDARGGRGGPSTAGGGDTNAGAGGISLPDGGGVTGLETDEDEGVADGISGEFSGNA